MLSNPQTFKCSYDAVSTCVCAERNCSLHPFMCDQPRCNCKKPHHYHLQMRIEELYKRIRSTSDIPIELRNADQQFQRMLLSINNTVEGLRKTFKDYLESIVGKERRYQGLIRKLLAGEPLRGDEKTGDSLARMLQELQEPRQIRAFQMAPLRELQSLSTEIENKMNAISEQIKRCYGITKEKQKIEVDRPRVERSLFNGDILMVPSNSHEVSAAAVVHEINRGNLFQKYPYVLLVAAEEGDHLYPQVRKLAEDVAAALGKHVEETRVKLSRGFKISALPPTIIEPKREQGREPIIESKPPSRVQEKYSRPLKDYIEPNDNVIRVTPSLNVADAATEAVRKWDVITKEFSGVAIEYHQGVQVKGRELFSQLQNRGFRELNRREREQNVRITMVLDRQPEILSPKASSREMPKLKVNDKPNNRNNERYNIQHKRY